MFGTSEFAVPVLEAVAQRHDVVAVVTQPDRPAGRGHKLAATPVKRAAQARGLRVLTPEKLRPFTDEARALGADAFVVASYGKIVPQSLLDLVPVAFNVHPSLLPLYRGATPLQSAIRDGRTETGVTIIAMDTGMDTGDVLLQERTPLGPDETYGKLHDRLAQRGAELAAEALERHVNGTLDRKPQSEVARELGVTDEEIARTLTRPLRKEDLVLDWTRSGKHVVDQIRSLAPSPAAKTDVRTLRTPAERPDARALRAPAERPDARALRAPAVTAASDEPQWIKVLAAHVEPGVSPFDALAGSAAAPSRSGGLDARAGSAVALSRSGGLAAPYGAYVVAGPPAMTYGIASGGDVVALDRVVPPARGTMTGEAFARSVLDHRERAAT